MKRIVILGSTGSVGTQALDIIRQHPDKFKVVGLAANRNIEKLQEQIEEFRPEAVCVVDEQRAELLRTGVPVYKGKRGSRRSPFWRAIF